MNTIKQIALFEPLIDIVPDTQPITDSCCIFVEVDQLCDEQDLDINTVKKEDLDFKHPFELNVLYSEYMHAFVGYFEIFFPGGVSFSTSPFAKETHWKQTVFYFHEKMWCCHGDIIKGVIDCHRVKENPRDLDVQIEWELNQKGHIIPAKEKYRIRYTVCMKQPIYSTLYRNHESGLFIQS